MSTETLLEDLRKDLVRLLARVEVRRAHALVVDLDDAGADLEARLQACELAFDALERLTEGEGLA
jgi:hypothetical protein